MKKLFVFLMVLGLVVGGSGAANATFETTFDFETGWSGDYAPGWENTDYRWGTAPLAQMMQQTTTAHSGSYGVQLIAEDYTLGQFWVGVNPSGITESYLDKQYSPYLSAWYYEENKTAVTGQIFAVPNTVITDVPGYDDQAVGSDWTDVQFGGRRQPLVGSNFYYITASADDLAGTNSWVNTSVVRSTGWHELVMQLTPDGNIHFSLDGNEVGVSTRNDYTNLGTVGLYTMFDPVTFSGTTGIGSSTIWDDVRVGSTVPEPATMMLLGLGLVGLAGLKRKFRS